MPQYFHVKCRKQYLPHRVIKKIGHNSMPGTDKYSMLAKVIVL